MYIKVRVVAGMRKEKVIKLDEVTYQMTVREPVERNLANNRIRTILADEYGVEEGKVRIISGHHSQSKIFDVSQEV